MNTTPTLAYIAPEPEQEGTKAELPVPAALRRPRQALTISVLDQVARLVVNGVLMQEVQHRVGISYTACYRAPHEMLALMSEPAHSGRLNRRDAEHICSLYLAWRRNCLEIEQAVNKHAELKQEALADNQADWVGPTPLHEECERLRRWLELIAAVNPTRYMSEDARGLQRLAYHALQGDPAP